MSEDSSNGRVTLRDVYAVVQRLEDKMDQRYLDHETRLRFLENNASTQAGEDQNQQRISAKGMAFLAVIVSAVGDFALIVMKVHGL